ncbi:MAG TPA: tetratricopeptide repeat protein [Candidatus Acidoferrales bacterium]|nr:tetratricopeptide repeat protein [Candidatus Acidoferrales bacterium]
MRYVSAEDQALHDLLVKAKAETDANNYADAQTDYEKYLAQRPSDAAAHFDLGYVFTAQKEKDKAIAEYRKAVQLDPKMMDAQLNLGLSLLSDDPKDAIEPLQNVIMLNDSFERGHFLLGVAEERAGNAADADKEFSAAIKLDPNDTDAHEALGRIYLAAGKAADAEDEFRQVLRLKPNDQKDDQQAELGLAESLLRQKKNAAAADALTTYLNADPNDGKARFMQASVLADLGKNDEALAALDRAAKDAPETIDALKLRSAIDYRKKKFADAVTALQKAEPMAPSDASIHASLGHALLETKNYPNAARELSEALRLDPSSTGTLRDLVSAEYLQNNFSATLAALDALAQHQPPTAGDWFVRALCYDHGNQPEQALAAYQKFLAMNTNKNSDQYFQATERVRFLQLLIKKKGH